MESRLFPAENRAILLLIAEKRLFPPVQGDKGKCTVMLEHNYVGVWDTIGKQ